MAINVTDDNFQAEVIEKSGQTPVLVDFWAEWCGPCRMLGPVLDKVETDFNGRFILAKLDTDHNQNIAGAFKISGIPAVKLFIKGKVVDEFTGAMSEPNVLKFLEKHIADPAVLQAVELAKTDPVRAAEKVVGENLHGQLPEEILWNGVKEVLRGRGERGKLRVYIEGVPAIGSKFSDGRKSLLSFLDGMPTEEDMKYMELVVSDNNKRDGLDYFLKKVENAGEVERYKAKEILLSCFFLIGTTEQIVNEYRKKLAALLF